MKLFLGVLLAAARSACIKTSRMRPRGGAVAIFGLLAHPAKESLRRKWIDLMSDFNAGLRSGAAAGASR